MRNAARHTNRPGHPHWRRWDTFHNAKDALQEVFDEKEKAIIIGKTLSKCTCCNETTDDGEAPWTTAFGDVQAKPTTNQPRHDNQ